MFKTSVSKHLSKKASMRELDSYDMRKLNSYEARPRQTTPSNDETKLQEIKAFLTDLPIDLNRM